MYEKIKTWLEKGRDYSEGLDLFGQASKNRALYMYLLKKKDMVKLVYELQKLLKILPQETAKLKVVKDSDPVTDPPEENKPVIFQEHKKVNRDDLPEDLQKVYDEISEKYAHQRAAHERMKLEEVDDAIRAKAREEVVKLDDEIMAGWKLIDDYLASKTEASSTPETTPDKKEEVVSPAPEPTQDHKEEAVIPPAPEPTQDHKEEAVVPPAKDPLSFTKEVNAARTYISRNLGKVATSDGAVKDDLVKKLKDRYRILVSLKADIDPETIDKLFKAGIIDKT